MSRIHELLARLQETPEDDSVIQEFLGNATETGDYPALETGLSGLFESDGAVAVPMLAIGLADALSRSATSAGDRDASERLLRAARLRLLAPDAHEVARAVDDLANAWGRFPDPRILDVVGQVLGGPEDTECPDELLMAYTQVGPPERTLWALRVLAERCLDRGEFDESERYVVALLTLDPGDDEARLRLAALQDTSGAATRPFGMSEPDAAHLDAGPTPHTPVPLAAGLEVGERAEGTPLSAGDTTRGVAFSSDYNQIPDEGEPAEIAAQILAVIPRVHPDRASLLRRRLAKIHLRSLQDPGAAYAALGVGLDDSDTNEHVAQARTLATEGAWSEATEVLQAALSETAAEGQGALLLELARIAETGLADPELTESAYRRVRMLNPKAIEALTFFSEWYVEQKDARRAYAVCAQLHGQLDDEDTLADRVELAREMARLADQDLQSQEKTIEAWRRLLEDDPQDTEANERLRATYRASERWGALADHLERWVEVMPNASRERRVELLFELTEIYQNASQLPSEEKLLEAYRRIAEDAPENERALDHLAHSYEDQSRWRELVGVLEQKLQVSTDPLELLEIHHRIASLYFERIRSDEEALPVLQQLLAMDPDNPDILRHLREIHLRRFDQVRVYETYQEELRFLKGRDRLDVLVELATIASRDLRNHEEALDWWRQVLELDGSHSEALRALQDQHTRMRDWPAYVELLEKRLEGATTRKERVELLQELGEVTYDRLQDTQRALEIFQTIQELSPFNARARHFLRRVHVEERDWESLRSQYEGREDWTGYMVLLREAEQRAEDTRLSVDIYMEIARAATDLQDDESTAREALSSALELDPTFVESARKLVGFHGEHLSAATRSRAVESLAHHGNDGDERPSAWREIANRRAQESDMTAAHGAWLEVAILEAPQGSVAVLEEILDTSSASDAWAQTAEALSKVLELLPRDSVDARLAVHRELGIIHRSHLGDAEGSARHHMAVLAEAPGDEFALAALEEIHLSHNDFEGLERVLQMRADQGVTPETRREGNRRLGQLYEDVMVDLGRAAATFHAMLENDADDAWALSALRRVRMMNESFEAFVADLEELTPRISDPAIRGALTLEQARLVRVCLHDYNRAASILYDVLMENGPDSDEALATLEAMFASGEAMSTVSELLDKTYREREDLPRLAHVLEVRLGTADDTDERLRLVSELHTLYTGELKDTARAFDVLCTRFELAPSDRKTWAELEGLAETTQLWGPLATRWQSVLAGEGRGPGFESPSEATDLRVRLAALVHHRLGRIDEAIDIYERIITDAEDLSSQDEILEALEAIYVERDAAEDVVRIRLVTAGAHIDGNVRRSKMLDACALLADRLDRPEDALAHYERLVEENPADDEFADRYENTLQRLERWEPLIEHLERRSEALGDADSTDRIDFRRAMVHLRRLGDLSVAMESLLALVSSASIGSQVHEVLRDLAIDRSNTEETRSRIIATLTEHYHTHEDRLGRAALLELKGHFATGGMNRAHLLLEAGGLVLAEVAEIGDESAMLRERAFGLYGDALREVPTSAVTLSALDELVDDLGRWEVYADLMAEVSETCSEPAVAIGMRRRAAHAIETHLEDIERAIICWEAVTNADRKHSGAHRKEALAALDRLYKETDRKAGRVKVLQQRVELTDRVMERVDMLRDAARLLHDLGRNDEAISTLQGLVREARATRRKDLIAARTQALEHLDMLLTETKRHEDLVQLLVENAEENRDSEVAKLELYRAAEIAEERMHRPALAVEIFEKVRELERFDEIALSRLDRLYTTCGQWTEKIQVLEDRIELARRAQDDQAQREIWFTLGQLRENRMHDSVSAVEAYASCLASDPTFVPAIAALQLGATEAVAGGRSREVLAEAFRTTTSWAELASCLQSRITHGDEAEIVGGFETELASLYLDFLDRGAEAWPHASIAYRAIPLDREGLTRRSLLARSATAAGLPDELAALLLEVARTISPDEVRLTRLRDDIELLAKGGADDGVLAPFWREIIQLDGAYPEALTVLERVAREACDIRELVDVLRRRADSADDPSVARRLRIEMAQILGEASGEEDEAIGLFHALLMDAPEDLMVFEQLASLYRRMERWQDLAELLRGQLQRTPDADDRGDWNRELSLLSWQVFEDAGRAVTHARATLADHEDDDTAVALLVALGTAGREPQAVLELLEPVYERAGDNARLAALYIQTLDNDPRPPVKRSVLPRLIEIQMNRMEDPERAYESTKALVKVSEDRHEHLDHLAALASDTERWPDLVDFLEGLLGPEPTDIELLRRTAALALTQLDDTDRALVHQRTILHRDPADLEAREAITTILTDAERWEALVAHLRIVADTPGAPEASLEALLMAAEVLDEHLERTGDAASLLQSAVALDPTNDDVSERLASSLEALGDRDRLHGHYRAWMKSSPPEIAVALQLRLAAALLEKPDSAKQGVEELRTLIDTSEVEAGARSLLDGFLGNPEHLGDVWRPSVETGISLMESLAGDAQTPSERAELSEILLRTLDAAPEAARATRLRAAAQREEAGDVDEAIAHFAHLLSIEPESADLATQLTELADRHERWADLASILSQTVTDGVAHGTRSTRMAQIAELHLRRLDDPSGAVSWYERLLESDPAHQVAFDALSSHYRDRGLHQDEARVLSAWPQSANDPASSEHSRRLAALQMDELGELQGALELLEQDLDGVVADDDLLSRAERLYGHFERYQDLVSLYHRALAQAAAPPADRVQWLAKLTQVAEIQLEDLDVARESALALIAIEPKHAFAMGSLERVARTTGSWDDLDRAFELQLNITHDDAPRAALLMERGETALRRLHDPLRALDCAMEANDLLPHEQANERLVPLLEALLDHDSSRLDAATALEPLLAHAQRWTDQIAVVQTRLDAADDPAEAEDLARHLAALKEERIEDSMAALSVLIHTLERFPALTGLRSAVDRLASKTAGFRRVASALTELIPKLDGEERVAAELWLGTIRHENLDDAEGATKALESVVEQEPAHHQALEMLAKIYERAQHWDALISTYERLGKVTGQSSDRAHILMKLADVLESRLEAFERARVTCEEALTLDPGNQDALAMMERIARHRQDFGELDAALARRVEATSTETDRLRLLLQRADNLLSNLDKSQEALALVEKAQTLADNARDHARIISLYEVLLDREATRLVAARHLTEPYESTSRWSDLVRALEIVCAEETGRVEKHTTGLKLATVYETRLNDAPAALRTYLTLLNAHDAPMSLAPEVDRLALATDAWGVVSDHLDAMLQDGSQSDRLAIGQWLGRIHLDHRDDLALAIGAYERVLEIEESHSETLELLEGLYEETGDGASLMSVLSARVASTPGREERVGLLMKKARVAEDELGDLEAARQACEAILALSPGHQDSLEALERFASERGDWADMERVLASRLSASSSRPERLHLTLSRARNLLKHLDSAAQALELTIEADEMAHEASELQAVVSTFELLLGVETTQAPAAERLAPRYEDAKRWADLVDALEVLRRHGSTHQEREAVALRSSKLAEGPLGDGPRGVEILLNAFERDPHSPVLRHEISRMAERADRWARVSEVVGPILNQGLQPAVTVDLGLWLARIRREHLDSPTGAASALERVLAVDAVQAEALNGLDEIYRSEGQDDRLRSLLEARLAVVPDAERPHILEELADVTYRSEGPAASLNVWRQLIWERPDHDEARERIVGMLGAVETMRSAAAILEPIYRRETDWPMLAHILECKLEAAETPQESAAVRVQLAELYERRLDDSNRAFRHFAEFFVVQPERLDVGERLAGLAKDASNWEDYAAVLERAVAHVTDERLRVRHLVSLASVLEEHLGDPEGAIEAYERALVIDEQEASALAGLRRLYQADEHQPGMLDTTLRLASMEQDSGAALGLYREALSLAADLDEPEAQIRACKSILRLDPEDDAIADLLGDRYEEAERYEALAELLAERVDLTTDAAVSAARHQRLADLRATKLMDLDGALVHYAEAWDRDEARLDAFEALEATYRDRRSWGDLYGLLSERATRLGQVPQAAGVWLELASVAERHLDDIPEAMAAYERAVHANHTCMEALDALIRLYHKHERHRELARCYEAKSALLGSTSEATDLRALAANLLVARLGEDEHARELVELVLEQNEQHALGSMVRARLLARSGDAQEAAEVLEFARVHLSGDEEVEALVLLGRLYREDLERPQAALDRLTLAQKLAPSHPDLADALRDLYEKTGAWSELSRCMEDEYEAAEEANERCARALALARLHLDHLGNEGTFLLWVERAREAKSDSVEAAEALISFYTAQEQWSEVAPHLEWLVNYLEGKRLVRDLPVRAHELAAIFRRLGRREDALQYHKMAMNADGSYLENLLAYGRLLVEMGRWDRALRVYQSLLMQQQNLPDGEVLKEMLYNLGLTCHELGMAGQGQQHIRKLLELDPDHALGIALRKRLV